MNTAPLLALVCCITLAACSDEAANPVTPVRNLTQQESVIVQSSNKFGFDLFRKILRGQDPADNIFISPVSVSYALGMTMNGPQGDSNSGTRSVLKFEGLSEQEINESYQMLTEFLQPIDANVTMDIANSIWYRDGFTVELEFFDKSATYFDASVQALDFSAPDAANIINDWVKLQTNSRIESIVDQHILYNFGTYLLSALCSKTTWQPKLGKGRNSGCNISWE